MNAVGFSAECGGRQAVTFLDAEFRQPFHMGVNQRQKPAADSQAPDYSSIMDAARASETVTPSLAGLHIADRQWASPPDFPLILDGDNPRPFSKAS